MRRPNVLLTGAGRWERRDGAGDGDGAGSRWEDASGVRVTWRRRSGGARAGPARGGPSPVQSPGWFEV